MKNVLQWLGILLLAGFATGCIETSDKFTLNPDGSGKVTHTAVVANLGMDMFGGEGGSDQDPEKEARKAAKEMVESSEGVDAWSDVGFEALDDGRMKISGTAYFPDVNKLKVSSGGVSSESDFTFTSDGADYTLAYSAGGAADGTASAPAETAEEIQKARSEMQQSMPMMTGFLSGLRMESRFHLPGTVKSSNHFTKETSGAYALIIEGEKLLQAMQELVTNDDWIAIQVSNKKGGKEDGSMAMDTLLQEKLFGSPGSIVLAGTAAKPLFDYAAESATAKAGEADMLAALGIVAPVQAEPATGGIDRVIVGGVQWVSVSDSDDNVRPFNYDEGFRLSLIADLPGAALETSSQGAMTMGDSSRLDFSCEGGWPETGKIVVEQYKDLKKYEAEFAVENVALLGRPR
jgi:hypothetical protein